MNKLTEYVICGLVILAAINIFFQHIIHIHSSINNLDLEGRISSGKSPINVVIEPPLSYFTSDIPFTAKLNKNDLKQVLCLSENLYFEARNQTLRGIVGVAYVTRNRVLNSKYFKNDYCGVVFEKSKHGCQFSWTCNGKKHVIREPQKWEEIKTIATNFYLYHSYHKDITDGALFYHTKKVHPKWKNVIKTLSIGDHIFYRVKNA